MSLVQYHSPLQQAAFLAKAASLAYENISSGTIVNQTDDVQRKLQTWTLNGNAWTFDRIHSFTGTNATTDTQAYLASNDEVLVLAFRGTEQHKLRDWITDLKSNLVQFPGSQGRVHHGFQEGLDIIWEDLFATLKQFRHRNQPLLVTGHSLGGALATLAVARLQWEQQSIQGLYTFGSPRVGDKDFANDFVQLFHRQTFRFVNHDDVVTRIAPRLLRYEHVGRLMYINESGQLRQDTNEKMIFSHHLHLADILEKLLPDHWFHAHDLEVYQKWLLQGLENPVRELAHRIAC